MISVNIPGVDASDARPGEEYSGILIKEGDDVTYTVDFTVNGGASVELKQVELSEEVGTYKLQVTTVYLTDFSFPKMSVICIVIL